MGSSCIDLLPWIPVNNIQGLNTPTYVNNVQEEMPGQREHTKSGKQRNKKVIKLENKLHMHKKKHF